ncbi:membrane lipoprotein lipid attachment site-containing protein [Hyphomonas sp.]|uniref:membrane lipoprotein lipid attachment site-containing protein n=1 Tax=Hyphomonas sp. TaxID=87 RepID=UPI00391A6E4A
MKRLILTIGLLTALAACQPEAEMTNAAVATDEAVAEREAAAPATGANSFTEAQAQGHLTNKGYSNPSALVQTDTGEWVGQATLNGEVVNVSVDYQGNVVVTD